MSGIARILATGFALTGCSSVQQAVQAYGSVAVSGARAANDTVIEAQKVSLNTEQETAAIVVNVDAAGPGAAAGILLGDIVTAWNSEPIGSLSALVHRLGPESVGTSVTLSLVRGGQPLTSEVGIIERPAT